jgi:Leucine-rich repeat (LRR) protein
MVAGQLSFLSVLDLSKNSIVNPLADSLKLPKLRELRLHGNKIQSLDDVTSCLSAPNLQQLDVSNNRLSGTLPPLREFFPGLLLLIASDNGITEVPAESLQGLKTVNLSNNDIGRLDPHIGLHIGTLTSLDVDGNKFRVPNHAVLKKGTDAVLNWLRDKIPSPTEEFFTPGSPGY